MLDFPGHITDAMNICALRFDGYKYEEVSGISEPDVTGAGLSKLIEPIMSTLTLHADANMNFAAFFGLQRYLHKWGGECGTKYSDEHIAYDFLFLHLYDRDVPDDFANAQYCAQWQRDFEEHKEEIAGFVRSSFRRKGQGKKIDTGMVIAQPSGSSPMVKYKQELVSRFLSYQQRFFPKVEDYFDQPFAPDGRRPPVFLEHAAWRNVLINPNATQQETDRLIALVPDRHQWFRSMNSSQALALSVLGNLANSGLLDCLADVEADEGQPLLGGAARSHDGFAMEFKINHLGEPRPTSLDGYLSGTHRIAIECKFTESDIGCCSRPKLTPADSKYESEYCSGGYSRQKARKERCPLSEIGVLYWKYVPYLFKWESDTDLIPCPLNKNYQLVRNILAMGVKPDGTISPSDGHVAFIYDERNPANHEGGNCHAAYMETRAALREPTMLRKCSWQHIIQHIRRRGLLPWLTESLAFKYGL